MNLHPIIVKENIRQTTGSANFSRKRRRAARLVWFTWASFTLFIWAAAYFASRAS